jgi:hypothetical protein
MKLTDFLSGVGRPVAYYPSLRRITGSTNATIFLCQLIYWKGKEADPNGWLYKESDEIEVETGLSYGEQKTARRLLVEAGIIEEHYARLDHQMRFRLNLDVINEKWGNEDTAVPESGKPQLGNEGNPRSLIETETTTENTSASAELTIENAIATNQPIRHADTFDSEVKDAANLIDMGCAGAGALAAAFMTTRKIIIPSEKAKGNRKAAREMLAMGVKPEHVVKATEQLIARKMTIIDLFGISKTAIDLANKPEERVEKVRLL